MIRTLAPLAVLALALGGCGLFEEDEEILPGERVSVRAAAPVAVLPPGRAQEVAALGAPRAVTDWPQLNALPSRAPGHVAGPSGLSEAWSVDVGAGASESARITASPVVAGGRIFTLDAASGVAAVDAASGRVVWTASVAPEGQGEAEGFGGGPAFDDGRVFVATGFGDVVALNAADGQELWRFGLGAPLRAAPAVADGRVIAVTRDNTGFGLDARTGAVLWRVLGARGGAGFLGGASPAVSGELAVLPFTSGELVAVLAGSGRRIWSDALTGAQRGSASANISDISGDPVIAGPIVFASNYSGQMVAIDARNGQRGWLRPIGSAAPVWPAGATVFVMAAGGDLMRLAAATGEALWSTSLPEFEDPEDREGAIAYRGPVVAGERVYVTSSNVGVLVFDAQSGEEVARVAVPGGVSTGPVIVGGTLYVLSDSGRLHAYR